MQRNVTDAHSIVDLLIDARQLVMSFGWFRGGMFGPKLAQDRHCSVDIRGALYLAAHRVTENEIKAQHLISAAERLLSDYLVLTGQAGSAYSELEQKVHIPYWNDSVCSGQENACLVLLETVRTHTIGQKPRLNITGSNMSERHRYVRRVADRRSRRSEA